jgi:hypothetical protein
LESTSELPVLYIYVRLRTMSFMRRIRRSCERMDVKYKSNVDNEEQTSNAKVRE